MPFMYRHVAHGPFSSLLKQAHHTPVQVLHELRLYSFLAAVQLKSQRKQEAAASSGQTGHRAPVLTVTVTTGLLGIGPAAVSPCQTPLSVTLYWQHLFKHTVRDKTKQNQISPPPKPESNPSKSLLNL